MNHPSSSIVRRTLAAGRSLFALAIGFVVVQVVLYGTIGLVMPELLRGATFPTGGALVVLLTIEILAGAAGVLVAAMLAARAAAAHGWTLGLVIMVFNLWVVTGADSPWPLVPAIFVVGAAPLQTWAAVAMALRLRRGGRSGRSGGPIGPEAESVDTARSAAVVLLVTVVGLALVLLAPRSSAAHDPGGDTLPHPGITWDGLAQQWAGANGSGIWLSPGNDGNEIAGNTFEDIAADAVVIQGGSNRVALRSADDTVRDFGNGNRVAVPQESDTLALTGVTLIDGTGAPPRPAMTVLLVGDRIERVVPTEEGEVPASATVLDLDGHYLIPGLINSHFHIPMVGWERNAAPPALERMLHAGVTTIREMAGDLRLTAELDRAALIEDAPFPTIHSAVRMAGPTYYEAGAGTQGWVGYEPGTAPWAQAVTAETDLPRAVAVAAATGASGIKLYADLDPDLVRRIVDEAHRQGLKTWAHGTVFPAGPMDLLRAGVDGLSHACFLFWGLEPVVAARMADRPFGLEPADLGSDAFRELLEEMAARGVVMDATARNASGNPGASSAGCPPEVLNNTLVAMHAAGVPISTGTDYFIAEGEPDPTLFTEIEYLVDAGVLTPLEAITAATLSGARAIGIEASHGSIEAGKVADLVILSADPSEDIGGLRAIVAVIKDGRLYRRSAYDERIRGEP